MSHTFDLAIRFWDDIIGRPSGPMAFRLVLQPVMASILAIRDGIKDAHLERTPYFWTIVNDPSRRKKRLIGGIRALTRVLILAAVMDVIYQIIELHGIRPLETVFIAFLLAFLPYLIVRGPATRIERRIIQARARHKAQSSDGR